MPITEKIKNKLNSRAVRTLKYELSMHLILVRNFISIFLPTNHCFNLGVFGHLHAFIPPCDASRVPSPRNRLALRQFDPHRETEEQLNFVLRVERFSPSLKTTTWEGRFYSCIGNAP